LLCFDKLQEEVRARASSAVAAAQRCEELAEAIKEERREVRSEIAGCRESANANGEAVRSLLQYLMLQSHLQVQD
jgi:hypothetical protein